MKKLIGICLLALVLTACGPLDALQGSLIGVRAFIEDARASGEIIPAKADLLITDIDDGAQSVRALKAELDAIPSGPEKRQLQSAAVRRAATKWRAIYARGNFGTVNPQFERYGRLANSAFIAVEAYYAARAGDRVAMPSAGARARVGVARPGAATPKSEKQLKREMDQAIKELEKAEKELKQ